MREMWVPVLGSSTDEVSSLGRVRRGSKELKVTPRRFGKSFSGFVEYQYNTVHIKYEDGKRKTKTLARVVLESFVGPGARGEFPLHIDGDSLNDRLDNLRWSKRVRNQGMEGRYCERPTPEYPEGRKGTLAGYGAHKNHGEKPCKECLVASKEYQANYNKENWNKQKEYQKRYREENREDILRKSRERGKIYYENNKERSYLRSRKRRARLKGVKSEPYTKAEVIERYGSNCHLCGGEIPDSKIRASDSFSFDHLHPLSDPDCPGDNMENIRPSHLVCNVIKGDKLMSEVELPFPVPAHRPWGNFALL